MKTSELSGALLDAWVAKAQGWRIQEQENGERYWIDDNFDSEWCFGYTPTRNWQQCGELIEKHQISCMVNKAKYWSASIVKDTHGLDTWYVGLADNPQEAICRAVVASVYGEEVSDGN